MYEQFEPLGAALGLPPLLAAVRREWLEEALAHEVNVAATTPRGEVVGHCFLAADAPGCAELAIFVHQDYRRQGVGTALLTAALECGRAGGLERVWSVTSAENRAALKLQERCGFRPIRSLLFEIEMEIDLAGCAPILCAV
jgi:GNAT superfamily N-acetyltransferase